MKHRYLLIIGLDEIVINKYMEIVFQCLHEGILSGYSVFDLCGQEQRINNWIEKVQIKPDACYYIPYKENKKGIAIDDGYFEETVSKYIEDPKRIKVYIATETSGHEYYLRFFMSRGISVLVEKPVVCPLNNGEFAPDRIMPVMSELLGYTKQYQNYYSVMNLGRYSPLFYDRVYVPVRNIVNEIRSPITSLHIRHCGGVWNTHKEYDIRRDHPYKYGYGMLMQGGYHYIDLFAQFIYINKELLSGIPLTLSFVTYMAGPTDQELRIGAIPSKLINDIKTDEDLCGIKYGETDFVTVIQLSDTASKRIITLGSICLEQTTASIRNWSVIPTGQYNKNGRICDMMLDVSVSIAHRTHLHSYDISTNRQCDVDNLTTNVRISKWNNTALLPKEKPFGEYEFRSVHHSDGNKRILYEWLCDQEHRSSFDSHMLTMEIVQSLALSISKPGTEIKMQM